MARAALGWSTKDLSKTAGVGLSTVRRFETKQAVPIQATLAAIRTALEQAGVEFIGETGVKLRGGDSIGNG